MHPPKGTSVLGIVQPKSLRCQFVCVWACFFFWGGHSPQQGQSTSGEVPCRDSEFERFGFWGQARDRPTLRVATLHLDLSFLVPQKGSADRPWGKVVAPKTDSVQQLHGIVTIEVHGRGRPLFFLFACVCVCVEKEVGRIKVGLHFHQPRNLSVNKALEEIELVMRSASVAGPIRGGESNRNPSQPGLKN